MPAEATGWLFEVEAVALTLPGDALFSHQTAAQLSGLVLPVMDEWPLHVSVPTRGRRGRRSAVRWHSGRPLDEPMLIRGLSVTGLVDTWRGVSSLDLPHLVAVTDQILARGVDSERLLVPDGYRGAVNLRRARSLADVRSRSVRESILRVYLALAGLPAPEINFDVIVDQTWIGTGDFVWPEFQLYLEYDGGHHADPGQRHQDALTRNELADLGWTVRVLTSRHFRNLERTVAEIAGYLRHNGWSG